MKRVSLFVSYAHDDENLVYDLLHRLSAHLKISKHHGYTDWNDRKIPIGEDWHQTIQRELESANAGLLFVSPFFLSRSYITTHEIPKLIDAPGKVLIPVMVKPIDFDLHDVKGLEKKQIFGLKRAGKDAIAYDNCSTNGKKDEFVRELFRAIELSLAQRVAMPAYLVRELVLPELTLEPKDQRDLESILEVFESGSDHAPREQVWRKLGLAGEQGLEELNQRLKTGSHESGFQFEVDRGRGRVTLQVNKLWSVAARLRILPGHISAEGRSGLVHQAGIRTTGREMEQKAEETSAEKLEPPCKFGPTDLRGFYEDPEFVEARFSRTKAARAERVPDAETANQLKQAGEGVDALGALEAWNRDPHGQPYCVVLGEYGIGKTTLLRKFTYESLVRSASEPGLPLTVYLDLRNALTVKESKQTMDLLPLLNELIRREWKSTDPLRVTAEDVLRWVREEGATLIFDGLDEVLVHLSTSAGQAFIRELWRALPAHTAKQSEKPGKPGRLIFSCRSSYFPTIHSQAAAFSGQDRDQKQRGEDYLALILLPFGEEQIRTYLHQALGEEAQVAWETINSVHNLRDLAERPYLLSLITGEISRLEVLRASGRTVRAVDLYDGFAERWLNRDDGKHTLGREDKASLTERLAAAMWAEGQREWRWPKLRAWLHEQVNGDPVLARMHLSTTKDRDLLEEDFRTATFVLRPDLSADSFRFAHTSMQEYFLARYLFSSLEEADSARAWDIPRPSDETFAFLGEFLAREGRGVDAVGDLLAPGPVRTRENALRYWLVARKKELPEPTPDRIDLSGTDLYLWEVDGGEGAPLPLVGADLRGADLRASEWRNVLLSGANLKCAKAYGATFDRVDASNADLSGFDASGSLWRSERVPAMGESADWSPRPFDVSAVSCPNLGHRGSVHSIVISPDGTHAISGSYDNTLILWDIETGRAIRTYQGHKDTVNCVAFSPDGTRALSGSYDNTLILWDIETGRAFRTYQGHTNSVLSVAFSPDGTQALSGSEGNTLILWDIATGYVIRTYEGHKDAVYSVAFSPDGTQALSASRDSTLILWDIASERAIRTYEGHQGVPLSAAFSPDGTRALSGSDDNTLILWDIATGRAIRNYEGHKEAVNSVAFSPDGTQALSGSSDDTLILWDIATGRAIRNYELHKGVVISVAFSPDGAHALSGSHDKTLMLWDIATGRAIRTYEGHKNWVWSVAFSPDGTQALSSSSDNTLILWDIATGRAIRTYDGHKDWVRSVAFSPDGSQVLSGSNDCTLILWETATGRALRTYEGHKNWVTSVAFCPDGTQALSGSDDNTLNLWDIGAGRPIRTYLPQQGAVRSVALSPDGSQALYASSDNTLILSDIANGRAIRTYEGHTGAVMSVAFSPDGIQALSGSSDNTLILWDIATGLAIRTYQGHTNWVWSVAFSPDGTQALSGSLDNTLILWDIATGLAIRTYQGHTNWV